jgi:hypothetical protein
MKNSLKAAHWRNGRLVDYGRNIPADAVEIPNEPFEASVRIVSYSRGCSSATFDLEIQDPDRQRADMFMADMLELVQRTTITYGEVHGMWWVRKRGQNYGLALHSPAEVPSH